MSRKAYIIKLMKRFFRKIWFWFKHPIETEYVKKVKHVAQFYPMSALEVSTAYNIMKKGYPITFKSMSEKNKWEFLERCFHLANEGCLDWRDVIRREWKERCQLGDSE